MLWKFQLLIQDIRMEMFPLIVVRDDMFILEKKEHT